MGNREIMPGKRVQFEEETWQAIEAIAQRTDEFPAAYRQGVCIGAAACTRNEFAGFPLFF